MDSNTSLNGRRLEKVKIGKDEFERLIVTVKIGVPEQTGEGFAAVTMEAKDPPHPDLVKALQAMAEHLINHAEFPSTWLSEITMISATVTHTNGVQGVVLTGKRELESCNAPLIVNTPHYTREPYNDEDESGLGIFSFDCGKAIDTLELEAIRYFDGKRSQLDLGLEDESENETESLFHADKEGVLV